MIDAMVEGWSQLGYAPKLAVLILILCLAPVLTAILRSMFSWPPAANRYTLRVPAWVLLEAGAFLVAVGIFWVSFLNMSGGYEGTGCAQILNDLRRVYFGFLTFLAIPVAVMALSLVSQRSRRGSHHDA